MKKRMRIISLVLSCIMIIGFVSLSYGADFEPVTGSAFGFIPSSGLKYGSSDVKATTANPVGSSTDPFYVRPQSISGTRYYLTNTGAVTQSSTTIGNFTNIVTELTYSMAYNAVAVCNRINALGTTYLSDIKTYTSSLVGKLGNVESDVDDLRRYFDTTYYQLITSIDNKLTTIKNSAGLGPFMPYYMPDPSVYDYTDQAWTDISLRKILGTAIQTDTLSTDSLALQLRSLLNTINDNIYYSNNRIMYYVMGDTYAEEEYNKEININAGNLRSQTRRSMWADIKQIRRYISQGLYWINPNGVSSFKIYDYDNTYHTPSSSQLSGYLGDLGQSISQSLGRLAYVLANDEDIQLRQQTQDQQTAYKTNFTASNASGRMSGSDIADTANAGSEIKSAFTSSASGRDAFNGFSQGTDGRWDWFSTEILNSLDTTTNNRKSNDNLTNFLGNYYNEVIRYAD